jgi:uncharacterized lipoprotein YmbA
MQLVAAQEGEMQKKGMPAAAAAAACVIVLPQASQAGVAAQRQRRVTAAAQVPVAGCARSGCVHVQQGMQMMESCGQRWAPAFQPLHHL